MVQLLSSSFTWSKISEPNFPHLSNGPYGPPVDPLGLLIQHSTDVY